MTSTVDAGEAAGPGGQIGSSHEELLRYAESLRPALWEDAAKVDRERDLTPRNVQALTDRGLFKIIVPREFGGHGLDAKTLLDVTAAIGRGCSSSAWVTGILNASTYILTLFSEQAQREVWASDPLSRIASPIQPTAQGRRVDGGMVVSAKWAYASGSLHSNWIIGMVPAPENPETTPPSLVLVPRSDVTIEDTWYVTGMRGTGSNTIVLDEVFIPEHRIAPFVLATGTPDYAHMAGILVVVILGPQLGMAQAALDFVKQKAHGRPIAVSMYTSQADAVPFQLNLAAAATKIDTAWLHARRATADVDAAWAGDLDLTMENRARIRADYAWASQQAREAVDILMSAHGTAAFAEFNPLSRIWRDIGTASRHAVFGLNVPFEMYGRTLLGYDPMVTPMV